MTIPGIGGTLVSLDALARDESAVSPLRDHAAAVRARREIRRWQAPLRLELGPAAGARTTFDRLAAPLCRALGYSVIPVGGRDDLLRARLGSNDRELATLVVTAWGGDPAAAWRAAVHIGIACGLRWSFICSGDRLRIVDCERTYSRRHLEFDLDATVDDERAFAVLWTLLSAGAMSPAHTARALERAIVRSDEHRALVRTALERGVLEAVQHLIGAFTAARRRLRRSPGQADVFDESLVVIYRVLFLLFAEARGLVPCWHPVFRDGYTIESLRIGLETDGQAAGLWEALQAIARLAHRGCQSGSLRVTPFNGHLFSPTDAPLADTLPLEDGAVRRALSALTTRRSRSGPVPIGYRELGVEQLGGIYERLLDFRPSGDDSPTAPALVRGDGRKRTGSFYTPRALTEYLVRRTLAPLVEAADPDSILNLKVLDPAMGSGAFLVAACRYLAGAYESALVREGSALASELGPSDRVGFRRTIAQRCLYGVDLNPMAVQLGRLSLWLATLAADRPLTFLDHRLRVGNSLLGASPLDVIRQPPAARASRLGPASLPLFEATELDTAIGGAISVRRDIASHPADTLEEVQAKERALAELQGAHSAVRQWQAVLDLWCAGWFTPGSRRQHAAAFGDLVDRLRGRGPVLPDHLAEPLLRDAAAIAGRERFFHWSMEFPEVFHDPAGQPLAAPGFDAVIGNPPWEMLRAERSAGPRPSDRMLVEFARTSGIYRAQGTGHGNLYQLFLERCLQLVRHGGRLGLVLPSSFAVDAGSAALRRAVLERTSVDALIGIENRGGVFPIHRGLRFLLLSTTSGGGTTEVPLRLGLSNPQQLDRLPESGPDPAALRISRGLLERLSGPALVLPDLRNEIDVSIVASAAFSFPGLGDPSGWGARFGRELNASDDRKHFTSRGTGLPVVEGKHIRPFVVELGSVRYRIPRTAARSVLDPSRTYTRKRLAYRDVASATNRVTLIAAVLPAEVVSTHTVFCLKNRMDDDGQAFLCGIFNSYVANYLVRLRVNTHVSVSILERLPVPCPPRRSPPFREIAAISRRLGLGDADRAGHARLQALVGRLYDLDRSQYRRILDTFPLVPGTERDEAMAAFCDIVG
ncbi:MAG TPA: N-6 DNA methylase [Vicinamibacterales bacterium]|nr:N-6 DNA methylase [Vicinamibacterales bacterium]